MGFTTIATSASTIPTRFTQYAYIPGTAGCGIFQSTVDPSTGQISTPSTCTGMSDLTYWITTYTAPNNGQYAYVSNEVSGALNPWTGWMCPINSDGTISSSCQAFVNSGNFYFFGSTIAQASSNSLFLFIGTLPFTNPGPMQQCSFNKTTGAVTSCVGIPNGALPSRAPMASSFATSAAILPATTPVQYLYVSDDNQNVIYVCPFTNGTVGTCTTTPTNGSPLGSSVLFIPIS